MGLDAAVWPNKNRVDLGSDRQFAKMDPDTGQLHFEDAELEKKHWPKLRPLLEHRIGNIWSVAELREEAIRLLGAESRIVLQVLYSGSHSGDFIPVGELPGFVREVGAIRKTGRGSQEMSEFLSKFEELIQTATREGNPIVFT